MSRSSHPIRALTCSWTYSHERIRAILSAGGLTPSCLPLSQMLGAVVTYSSSAHILAASAQAGGLTLTSTLRTLGHSNAQFNQVPVLLFDHENNLDMAREALRLQVTDYLCLALTDEVLVDRVRMLTENILSSGVIVADAAEPDATDEPHERSGLQWDASIAAIFSGGTWLQLSPVEWRLFETLLQRRGDTVPNVDLITGPLGRSEENSTTASLLRLHLSRLRAKVEEHGIAGLNIVTVRGRGYMLV